MDAENVSTCLVDIQGMRCQSCVRNIQNTIGEKLGVISITVDLEKKEGFVKYVSDIITPTQISESIDDMGFPCFVKKEIVEQDPLFKGYYPILRAHTDQAFNAKLSKDVAIPVDDAMAKVALPELSTAGNISPAKSDQKCFITVCGMTCASCVAAIEKHALKLEGN